jgi:hypothetical protein
MADCDSDPSGFYKNIESVLGIISKLIEAKKNDIISSENLKMPSRSTIIMGA